MFARKDAFLSFALFFCPEKRHKLKNTTLLHPAHKVKRAKTDVFRFAKNSNPLKEGFADAKPFDLFKGLIHYYHYKFHIA